MSRIVIFANGTLREPEQLRIYLEPADRIFCVNGGTRHVLSLGLTPDTIIGDLDSLEAELISRMEATGVSFQRHPVRKDKTDLELALDVAVKEQPDEILIIAAWGSRLDQSLANLLLLTRMEYATVRLTLVHGLQWATILRSRQSVTVKGQVGDTLSLIPLSSEITRVNMTGVEWPLEQATLSRGSTWSISNQLAAPLARIEVGQGLGVLVHIDRGFEEK
jgi:thiamine pyrophosphokinase